MNLSKLQELITYRKIDQNKPEKKRYQKIYEYLKRRIINISLKSEQSINELRKSNNNNVEIKEIKEKFNILRNKFSKEEIKEIRKKFHKKDKIGHRLEQLEKEIV